MSIGWSPTGREFVTGGYDATLRIFNYRSGHARDLYYTKRMQRVFAVGISADSKYIVSGSDDTNIRLWRVNASENSGVKTPREENALEYRAALLKKHSHLPEVSKITKSGKRRGPKFVKKQTRIAQIQKESRGNKLENRIKHSKPGVVKHPNEREDAVAKEIG
mmetsp:Transcript_24382/g.29925  ORF Transcript_24382/g.29925 Transcript_24382/m.29925 type:complete len:163 (+) Transcript_24382:74-562(+)